VNLPYTVTIGDKTLQPGEYTIQQNRDPGGASRVLLIYSDNGMKFETSAMTIPALDPNTARDTKVLLHHFGQDYYFDKIWIQGKDYGYEFPLPNSVKSREKEQMAAVSVPAQYSTMPAATTSASAESSTAQSATTQRQTTESATTNNRTTSAANTATTTAQSTVPQSATTTARSTTPQSTVTQTPTTSQSTMPATTTAQSTVPESASSANRTMQDSAATTPATTRRTTMPSTSAGWLMMLLGGTSLSGIGAALRRKR